MEPNLMDKFEALQLQNKEKLSRLKQREKMSSVISKPSSTNSFGVEDDLQLSTTDLMSSASYGLTVTLEDANKKMMEEIRELKDETGRLRKTLAEKDYEIRRGQKKVEKLESDKRILADVGTGIASDAAATKIVELSKRKRELTAEMEAEKTKSLQMMKRVNELEDRLQEQTNSKSSTTPRNKRVSPRTALAMSTEYFGTSPEELVEKLNGANLKLSEYRNQIQSLKQELKVANKVLCSELGETTVNIQALLASDGSGYRGRMLQINGLHEKIKDLEQKLSNLMKVGSPINRNKDKNFERIKAMEKQRREQNERMHEELEMLNERCKQTQQKFDASKARNKVLAGEIKSLKSQLNVLTDKGQHDDELITTLIRQQENLQKVLKHNTDNQEVTEKTEYKVSKEIYEQQQRERSETNRLKEILNERNVRILHLEEELSEMKFRLEEEDEGEYRPLKVFSQQKLKAGEVGKENQHISSPQSISPEIHEELQAVKIKNVELLALMNALEIEKERYAELVQVLNKRVENAIENEQKCNKWYHEEKRKTAVLEHSFEKYQLSNKPAETTAHEDSPGLVGRLQEVQTKLSIQTDENEALKEALESTLQSKQEDVKLFSSMMEQTKSVFLEALRSLKTN